MIMAGSDRLALIGAIIGRMSVRLKRIPHGLRRCAKAVCSVPDACSVSIQQQLTSQPLHPRRHRMVDTPLTYCIQPVKQAKPTITNVDVVRGREVT